MEVKEQEIIDKERLNLTLALALIENLYNTGKITKQYYLRILDKYGEKGLAEHYKQ